MSRGIVAVIVLAGMLVGLVGTFVPFVPGLVLVFAAALLGWLIVGFSGAAYLTLAVLVGLLVVGLVAQVVLPSRSATAVGVPRRSQVWGLVGALVGAVVLPVVGLPVGGLAGLYAAERARLADPAAAWSSTRGAARGIGLGILAELAAGAAMVVVWALAWTAGA